MDKLKLQRELLTEKEDKFIALTEKAKKEALSAAETAEIATLTSEMDLIEKDIKDLEAQEERTKKIVAKSGSTKQTIPGAPQDNASENKEIENIAKKFTISKMFQNRISKSADDGAEADVMAIAREEAAISGIELSGNIHIPSRLIQVGKPKKSLLDVTTEGTDVVFTEYGGKVIPILQPNPVVDQLGVSMYTGLRGDVQWPRHNGDVAFAWETETADVNETTPTFNNVSLTPKRVGGYVDISMKMLKQSIFVVEPWLRSRLENRYALTIDDAVFNGAGTNEPTGLFIYSGVNVMTLGSTSGDMTYNALMSMKRDAAVANARSGREAFVLDSYGAYSLSVTPRQSSGVEGNFIYPNATGPLLGVPTVHTNILDEFGSNLHGIIYGSNWGGVIVGTWGGLDILFDPYTQALGGKVRFVCNAFMNVEVEQPAEFTICKTWTAETTPALT
jgi:HK97 family phage major capsid protein